MMINFTEKAKKNLDKYLQEVRSSLVNYTSVDINEIQRDIIEHVEREFDSTTKPISLEELKAVLKRLGNPRQWIPEEELSWYQKVLLRLKTGPEDWRLAYISFALLLLSFCIHRPLSYILFFSSFLVSRAIVSEVSQHRETLGAQKWFIYPSLILIYIPIFLIMILWPVIPLLILAADGRSFWPSAYQAWLNITNAPYGSEKYDITWVFIIAAFVGCWWLILSCIILKLPGLLQSAFRPFAMNLNRKKVRVFASIGFIIMLIGIILVLYRCGIFG